MKSESVRRSRVPRRSSARAHEPARTVWQKIGTWALLATGGATALASLDRAAAANALPSLLPPADPRDLRGGSRAASRHLAEGPTATAVGASAGGFSALSTADIDLTPYQLEQVRKHWFVPDSAVLSCMLSTATDAVWGTFNRSLFGPDSLALRGGQLGASQATALDMDNSGVIAACETFAARFPQLLPQRIVDNGSHVTVNLQIKSRSGPGGFQNFPVVLDATLPVHNNTHSLVTANAPPNSTWSLYAAKAIWTLAQQPNMSPYNPGTFRGALQTLTGREIQEVDLTRLGDGDVGRTKGALDALAFALPSKDFDIWMRRLADENFGGLVFHKADTLAASPAYNPDTGRVEYSDGTAAPVLNGQGVRLQAPGLDVVLLGPGPYAVLGVNLSDAAQDGSLPYPTIVRLMSGSGFAFDPVEAAAYDGLFSVTALNLTRVRGVFDMPISWLKRLAHQGYFA